MEGSGRANAAPVSSRKPPVPAHAAKRLAERTSKSKCRARDCQQARTPVSSPSLSTQLGQQPAEEQGTRRTLSVRSKSLDMCSESPNMARREGPSRTESGVDGVTEQLHPQSALMCSLGRRVEVLEIENAQLKTELKTVRAMYDQLVVETSEERFDERRVLLLKGQVLQLERQVLLLSQALNDRSTAMLEVDNLTEHILHLLRSSATGNKSAPDKITGSKAGVHLSRDTQKELLLLCREVRSRLSASVYQKPAEHLTETMLFTNPFSKQDSQLTVLDVCMGGLGHLNLKHVARLESQFADLYHKLEQLQPNLCSLGHTKSGDSCSRGMPAGSPPHDGRAGASSSSPKDLLGAPCAFSSTSIRCSMLLSNTLPLLRSCCYSLLSLSLLVPAAPWTDTCSSHNSRALSSQPPLQGEVEVSLSVTAEEVVKSLPPLGPCKREVKEKLSSLCKCFQHALALHREKVKALEEEAAYHNSVHRIQVDYTLHLFSALSDGYQSFQQSVTRDLSAPLKALLVDYDELCETTSEESLSQFLTTFKDSSDNLRRALDGLERQAHKHLGTDTIVQLQKQFVAAIQARL